MNTLLLFFALPVSTIILAIIIQKILRCPFLTAAFFFAIYLIVAFAAFDANFLIFAIVYTILAFIAAVIAEILYARCERERDENNSNSNQTDTLSINVRNNQNGNRTSWCCHRR